MGEKEQGALAGSTAGERQASVVGSDDFATEEAAARSASLNVSASPGGSVAATLAGESEGDGSQTNPDERLTSVGKTKYNEKTNESG